MKARLLIFNAFLLIAISNLSAQIIRTGNLLKLRFDQKEVVLSDTAGYWHEYEKTEQHRTIKSSEAYYEHFFIGSNEYFLKKSFSSVDGPLEKYGSGRLILEGKEFRKEREIARDYSGCVIFPYTLRFQSSSIIIETRNGDWIINGADGNSFIANNDSLYSFESYTNPQYPSPAYRLVMIAGKVNGKYLLVYNNNGDLRFDFRLSDINDSPQIDSAKTIQVFFDSSKVNLIQPVKIQQLSDNIYIVHSLNESALSFYSFDGKIFHFQKYVCDGNSRSFIKGNDWALRENKLYIQNGSETLCYEFCKTDTTFINKKFLFKDQYVYADRELKYGAAINNDTLRIYDISDAKLVNSISLKGVTGPFYPVVDSPYVFIHQVKYQFTSVENRQAYKLFEYRINAYPNPFNNSTKIFFSLPEDKELELNVYDMLGMKVQALIKGFVQKGNHEILFDASDLPSGIYIYNLIAGNVKKTNKLVLLK